MQEKDFRKDVSWFRKLVRKMGDKVRVINETLGPSKLEKVER